MHCLSHNENVKVLQPFLFGYLISYCKCSKLVWTNFSPKLFGVGCIFLVTLVEKFEKSPFNQNSKLTIYGSSF